MVQAAGVTDINEYRLRRRRAGNIRWVLVLVFLLSCSVAGYFFAVSDFFSVGKILVYGNTQVDAQRLVELSGIEQGQNIFAVDVEKTAQWLSIEPRVKSAVIKRRLPATILITVTERQPVAMLNAGRALLTVDGDGRVLDRYLVVTELSLPLVSGVETPAEGMMPGGYIDGQGMEVALEILATLPKGAEGIGEINVANSQNICLYTVNGIEIRLGDAADFPQKYLVYSNIIRDKETMGGSPLQYIDVRIPDSPAVKYR